MKFFISLLILLFSATAYAAPYVTLYPQDANSHMWGPIEVVTCTNGDILGTDCGTSTNKTMYGFIVEIASGTVTLPAAEVGMWGCVKSTTAAVISIDVNAADTWYLDGVALSAGDKISSPGVLDDTVCFYASDGNSWKTVHNPDEFVDGN